MWKLTIEDDEGKQTRAPSRPRRVRGRTRRGERDPSDRPQRLPQPRAPQEERAGLGPPDLSELQRHVRQRGPRRRRAARSAAATWSSSATTASSSSTRRWSPGADRGAEAPPPAPPAPVHQRPEPPGRRRRPHARRRVPARHREHFTIGRAEDATISINHSSVSRVHAELIALGNGRYEIVDKASANGIRINGVELKRGILEAGDALELGDVRLRFVGAGKIFRADMTQNLPAPCTASTCPARRWGESSGCGATWSSSGRPTRRSATGSSCSATRSNGWRRSTR